MRSIVLVVLVGCGDLAGFSGDVPPLATIHVQVTGTQPAPLNVAMVWGKQWLVEPLCILPAESADAQAVIDAGCRDPFGFVPARVDANVPVAADGSATIELGSLPAADILVGDLTARVGYASLIAYEDIDGSGTLELGRPDRPGNRGGMGMGNDLPTMLRDKVQGASFVAMTQADQRIAFREGSYSAVAAFYPRAGCGDPPVGFSIDAAGGFTAEAAIAATLAGTLPTEDPATCSQATLDAATVTVPLRADPTDLAELACSERTTDSSVRYREPDGDAPDLANRIHACVHTPSFGEMSTTIELVIAGNPDNSCAGLTHFVLRGCDDGPGCAVPEWDYTATPPSWWPCAP
jgi:hypothetical protein